MMIIENVEFHNNKNLLHVNITHVEKSDNVMLC